MVEESSVSDDNTTTNKGVNVHSESLPVRVHRYTSETDISSVNISNRSITDIKNEIQNVLDLMGPSTPHLTHNTSSEADNEESLSSVQLTLQSKKKSASYSEHDKSVGSNSTGQKSSLSERKSKQSSVMADAGSYSFANSVGIGAIEHSCCDHAHFCVSPECLCMYMNQNFEPVPPSRPCEGYCSATNRSTRTVNIECKKRGLLEWLKERSSGLVLKKSQDLNPCELYKINICGQDDISPPKRVVFDLVEGIPKPSSCTVATNTIRKPVEKIKADNQNSPNCQAFSSNCGCKEYKNLTNEAITHQDPGNKPQKNIYYDSDGNTRIDYYYFDHGNAQFFHTTDTPPVMKCEILAEKTERYTTRFWAEFFASIHIGVSFCISFVLQLFKFLLYSIVRPLCVGLTQMGSDYFFKPCLTIAFNGVIQPLLIFLYNIATSVRDLCDPIAEAIGYFWKELAVLFRAIRLCTYKKNTNEDSNCDCNKIRKCEC